jgi:transcription termination factor NusB
MEMGTEKETLYRQLYLQAFNANLAVPEELIRVIEEDPEKVVEDTAMLITVLIYRVRWLEEELKRVKAKFHTLIDEIAKRSQDLDRFVSSYADATD